MSEEWIYGFHAVESVLKRDPKRVLQLWLQDDRRDKRIQSIESLAQNQGVDVRRVPRHQLDDTVDGRHQGTVARVAAREQDLVLDEMGLESLLGSVTNPLLLVLDGVTDPHNFGACLRSADAAGVAAVVIPKNNSADLSPVAIKVACGAAETVPIARVTNLARTLARLKSAGLWVVGTSGDTNESLYQQDLSGPIALVMGAEGDGMRRLTMEQCDFLVALPMMGSVSSLNVSVATGVCLFEALRQRQFNRQ
jgi:23S rRNA (guanosine2251-2'-O)-methyltransferase